MAPLRTLAVADLLFGLLLSIVPWLALPARVAVVDGGATGLGLLHVAAGAGLLAGRSWGPGLARAAAWVLVVLGAALLVALGISVSFLWGIYGDVGRMGAITLGAVIAILVPYCVGFPLVALGVLRRGSDERAAAPAPKRRSRK